MTTMRVPFFRPDIGEEEIDNVVATLRSGWLTTGARARQFEQEFAAAVRAQHAVAVNSCTAALHLAVEALGLKPGQSVIVPTLTFAATVEIVRYQGAFPILVDCDPHTLNMDFDDAHQKLDLLSSAKLLDSIPRTAQAVGVIPVHIGGFMIDIKQLHQFASSHKLWIVEDAAHAFPAAWRENSGQSWQLCGEKTASVSCFSFYANKTITTGEGGMAVTEDQALAERMRIMSLHGLSQNAWERYSGSGAWDCNIIAPGYKYNMTDIAAAIGIPQLKRAVEMRQQRENIASRYRDSLADIEEIELPPQSTDRVHSWHLFPIKLHLKRLSIKRNEFIDELKQEGVGCSVHWRPLHLHPYYQETFGWKAEQFPVATEVWERLISLPIFPSMSDEEVQHVIRAIRGLCARHSR